MFGGPDGLIQDNLFDGTELHVMNFDGDYNAFVTNSPPGDYWRLDPPSASDVVLAASPAYQKGPLGDYYQISNSVLINRDTNTLASQVGLYHYTICTNQVPETNGWLDVGLHYIAVDANGHPLDSDSGGVAN